VYHWRCTYEAHFGLDIFRANRALVCLDVRSKAVNLIRSRPLLLRQEDLSSRRAAQCLDVDVATVGGVLVA